MWVSRCKNKSFWHRFTCTTVHTIICILRYFSSVSGLAPFSAHSVQLFFFSQSTYFFQWYIELKFGTIFGAAGLLIWCLISRLFIRGRKSYLQKNIDFFWVRVIFFFKPQLWPMGPIRMLESGIYAKNKPARSSKANFWVSLPVLYTVSLYSPSVLYTHDFQAKNREWNPILCQNKMISKLFKNCFCLYSL